MRIWTPSDNALRATQAACEAIPEPDRVTRSGTRVWDKNRLSEDRAGIYFVGAMGADLIKIGWVREMNRIQQRMNRMQIDCPYPVTELLMIGPATRTHERRLHKHFIAQHHHGEWFRYAGELRALVDLATEDEMAAIAKLEDVVEVRFG